MIFFLSSKSVFLFSRQLWNFRHLLLPVLEMAAGTEHLHHVTSAGSHRADAGVHGAQQIRRYSEKWYKYSEFFC